MRRWSILLLGLVFGAAAPAAAQFFSFGQNKIQYRDFDWQVLKGPHVDLYYYPAEAHLAPVALDYAERSYDTLALQFGHEVTTRIPVIVYASHTDFEQTNILPFIPPEGLLGATDFLKRRVSLPYRGNLAEFRHTLRHEMVHVFQLSWLTENYYRNARNHVQTPLWWSEGLAELWSGGQDARDEMIMRDLTLSGRLPGIEELRYAGGGIVYPIGGRIHRWLADTYGDWRVAMFYRDMWRYNSFEEAILAVYGRTLGQLNEEFQLAMRRAYYPVAQDLEPLDVEGRRLATLALKPEAAGSGDSTMVYYLSPDRGYITIMRRRLDGGGAQRIIEAGRSTELEGFHPFESRLDASKPGLLLFSSQSGDRDALVVFDVRTRKVVGRYQFPELVSVLSPVWGPDGESVIFSGLAESGLSDLYRVHLPGGELEHLTDDPYQDIDPSVSPDGTRLVFASDRTAGGGEGAVNLFTYELATGRIAQVTDGDWVDETPRWASNGRIYYASSRDGVLNVFSVDSMGEGRRETSSWTGAFDPTWLPDRQGLLVGGFHDLSWNLYYVPEDSGAKQETFSGGTALAEAPSWKWASGSDTSTYEVDGQPYRRRFTLDFAGGDAVFIPGYGGAQGIQLFLSDLLSDEALIFGLSSFQGKDLGSIFENINASGIYINQKRRLNWGVGAFRLKGAAYQDRLTIAYREQTFGALGLLRYPLNRYERVEGQVVVERSDRTDFDFPDGSAVPPAEGLRRVGWLSSSFVSYVRDNALWLPSGPIDGGRFRLTAGLTSDFSNARFDSYLLNLDWRHYFRLGRRSAYAVRAMGFYSGGDRPRRVNIGGTNALRGYPLFGTIVGSRAWMLNQELRYPLLTHLTFGTPVGDVRFPGIQGAFFGDLGKAWFRDYDSRALLGSYGISFRMALGPLAVLRLDWGRKFSDKNFLGYPFSAEDRNRGFVQFFFGYNY